MFIKVILLTFYFFSCYKCGTFKDSSFQSHNNRFLQSKINVLTWLTNVCREYFLKPSYEPINLNDGWLQTDNWVIHNEEAIIEYTAKNSCREPNHPFPFGWLDNRMSTRTSLIKKDFFCKKTIAQLEVQMNDAQSCGFIFRILGERNYWSLMIDNKVLKLAHIKDGELIILKEFKDLKIKKDQWYVLFVQEILKDIKIKAGIYGDLSVEYLRKSDDETDYNENKQGAVGLIANKGRCKFRNIIMRGKKWSNEYEKIKKKNQGSLLYNIEEIEKLYDNTKDWCPNAALCSKKKYELNDS